MNRIDLQFLLLATVLLIIGVVMGIYMGATGEFQYSPVHAHINLVGWASLALFGLVYRAYPELGARKLARVHLLLAGSSAVLLPIGIALAVLQQAEVLAIVSAMLWLGGTIVFLVQLLSLRGSRARDSAPVATE